MLQPQLTGSSTRSGAKPPPPPKPSHLSVAFTGTLSSDALRAYIREQAVATGGSRPVTAYSDLGDASDDDEGDVSSALDFGGTARPSDAPLAALAAVDVDSQPPSVTPQKRVPLRDIWALADNDTPKQANNFYLSRNLPQAFASNAALSDPASASDGTDARHSRYVSSFSTLRAVKEKPAAAATDEGGDENSANLAEGGTGRFDVASWLRQAGAQTDVAAPRRSMALRDGPPAMASPSSPMGTFKAKVAPTRFSRREASTASSVPSTTTIMDERSRAPSVVSRLSVAQTDATAGPDSGEASPVVTHRAAEGSGEASIDTASSSTASTPSRILHHARDGSAFEHIEAPRSTPSKLKAGTPVAGVVEDDEEGEEEQDPWRDAAPRAELVPAQMLSAGPPPPRPESMAIDLEDISEAGRQEGEQEHSVESASPVEAEPASQPIIAISEAPAESSAASTLPVIKPPDVPATDAAPRPVVPRGRSARALYDFTGEARFNELTLRAGQTFEVLSENLKGGWSLAVIRGGAEGEDRKGLVPQGWYCYIQDFALSPALAAGQSSSGPSSSAPGSRFREPPALSLDSVTEGQALDFAGAQPSSPPTVFSTTDTLPARPASGVGEILPAAPNGVGALQTLSQLGVRRPTSAVPVPAAADSSTGTTNGSTSPTSSGWVVDVEDARSHGQELPDELATAQTPGTPPASSSATSSPPTSVSTHAAAPVTAAPAKTPKPPKSMPAALPPSRLFSGKSFNRFSPFVTSGVEHFLLNGTASSSHASEADAEAHAQSIRARLYAAGPGSALSVIDSAFDGASSGSSSGGNAAASRSRHYVVSGQHGLPAWKSQAPPFHVEVHSPELRWDARGAEYTVFCVSTMFDEPLADEGEGQGGVAAREPEPGDEGWLPFDPTRPPVEPSLTLSVFRRFSHFSWLAAYLAKHLPLVDLTLPPVPPKQRAGRARFEEAFIESRRRDLEGWLTKVVRHPVCRCDRGLLFFLGCNDDVEWNRLAPVLLHGESRGKGAGTLRVKPGAGGAVPGSPSPVDDDPASIASRLFADTYHPQFNVDLAEAEHEERALDAFNAVYEKAINEGPGSVMQAWKDHREQTIASSDAYRSLANSLLRMTTGHGVPGVSAGPASRSDQSSLLLNGRIVPPMGNVGRRDESGATNEDGAWCSRPSCAECLSLTRALQGTADALGAVADSYDDHARGALLFQHERLRAASRPHAQHAALMEVHRATVQRHQEVSERIEAMAAIGETAPAELEHRAARCETVLNATLSEMDRVHAERVEDWTSAGRNLLDYQIGFYEQVLSTLRTARADYDAPAFGELASFGPVLTAARVQHLPPASAAPHRSAPLPQPSAPILSPGVAESALRPVSLATEVITDSISSIFGGGGQSPSAEAARHGTLSSHSGHHNAAAAASRMRTVSQAHPQRGQEGSAYFAFWK